MNLHLVQEILFIASGVVLVIVAAAIALMVIHHLILGRGKAIGRGRRGQEERPSA